MRVLVCGGRDFCDDQLLDRELTAFHLAMGPITLIIHGDARGADRLAGAWANRQDVPVWVFHAAWRDYGRAAGPIRNKNMLEVGAPDVVLAFPGGKGTEDMCGRAKKAGVKVVRIGG